MKFSIIVPSFNQARFIRRTLDSILQQGHGKVQVIVSDGGSTDGTVDILKSYGDLVTWWSKPDKGYADAVNQCLPLVDGDVVGIQSSDDYYLPEAFAEIARQFEARPSVGLISGGFISIDLNAKVQSLYSQSGPIGPLDHLTNILPQHATFIRSDILLALGGVRPEVDMCADIDLWYRALHLCAGFRIEKLLAVYQLHPAQRSATSNKWSGSLRRMVEYAEGTAPYSDRFKLTDDIKSELFSYWTIYWSYAVNDPGAVGLARAAIRNGMRGYALSRKSTILFIACRSEPDRPAKILYSLKSGCFALALWSYSNSFVQRIRKRNRVRKLDLHWAGSVF